MWDLTPMSAFITYPLNGDVFIKTTSCSAPVLYSITGKTLVISALSLQKD